MEFIKLQTEEHFKNLKKGDTILVYWNNDAEVWDKEQKGKKVYNILYTQKADNYSTYNDEIILRKKGNIFFNCRMFLNGHSKIVKEVYLIESSAESNTEAKQYNSEVKDG